MPDQVHARLADGVEDGGEVGGQMVEGVVAAVARRGGGAGAAHVVADHVEAVAQQRGHLVPDAVGVRVAVDQQDGRVAGIALLEQGQPDLLGLY